jgi:hypothetical protein
MTSTQSLSERLREFRVVVYNPDGSQGAYYPPICTQAADALDAKDALLAQAAAALEATAALNPYAWNDGVVKGGREALAALRAKERP